jgi:hypothetical protein
MTPFFLPPTAMAFPLHPAQLLAGRALFSLIVKGSVVGLTAATTAILAIWFVEWRRGRVW